MWVPATHVGDTNRILGFWLQPGPAAAAAGTGEVDQQKEDLSPPTPPLFLLSHSLLKINVKEKITLARSLSQALSFTILGSTSKKVITTCSTLTLNPGHEPKETVFFVIYPACGLLLLVTETGLETRHPIPFVLGSKSYPKILLTASCPTWVEMPMAHRPHVMKINCAKIKQHRSARGEMLHV